MPIHPMERELSVKYHPLYLDPFRLEYITHLVIGHSLYGYNAKIAWAFTSHDPG